MASDRRLTPPVIVPVGDFSTPPDERESLITSIEIWSDRVILRYTESASSTDVPWWGAEWNIEDDAGTVYRCSGSPAE